MKKPTNREIEQMWRIASGDKQIVHGIELTAFLLSDCMRTLGVSDKDIEDGLMKVSEHWTETIPNVFGVKGDKSYLQEYYIEKFYNCPAEIKKEMELLVEHLNDDEPIFARTKTDNVVPLVSNNA